MRRTPRGSHLFGRRDFSSYIKGAGRKALAGVVVLLGALALLGLGALQAPHVLADPPQLQIMVPAPSGSGVAQGPVGANVSITAQIPDAPGDSYQMGWAPQSGSCTANFTAVAGSQVASDGSGNLNATFSWPSAANTVGASYYVCAQDITNASAGFFQSAQVFQVVASTKPGITISGQSSTGLKGIFAGGTLQINGDRFFPAGTKLYIFLNTNQDFSPADLQPDQALPTTDGSDITSAGDGGFTATVKLPDDATGQMFLHVVSSDGTQNFLPALVATRQITIAQVPTPTPNPTPSPVVTPVDNQGGANGSMPAIIGLGALSIVLFIVGVILIATVASSPGANSGDNHPGSGSGARY